MNAAVLREESLRGGALPLALSGTLLPLALMLAAPYCILEAGWGHQVPLQQVGAAMPLEKVDLDCATAAG